MVTNRSADETIMSGTIKRILSSLAYPVGFGGYLWLLHYGWQKLQYSPVVNEGGPPSTISVEKIKKALFGGEKRDDKK